MSGQFKIGEVVIGQHFVDFPEHNGEDLVIVGGARFGHHIDAMDLTVRAGVTYRVESIRGDRFCCAPFNLRRRPPSDSHERTYMQKWRDMAGKAPQRQGHEIEASIDSRCHS